MSWDNDYNSFSADDNEDNLNSFFGEDSDNAEENYDDTGEGDTSGDSPDYSVEDTEVTDEENLMDNIDDYLINAPRNATTEPVYSEKDVYQIINTVSILSVMTQEQKKWVEQLLSIGGDDVRMAMRITSLEDLDVHINQVNALQDIIAVSEIDDATKAVTKILGAIQTVGDLGEDDRDKMVTLVRKIIRDNDIAVPAKINKRSSDAELVDSIRDIIDTHQVVRNDIESMVQCLDMISSARR